jgi:predicted DNA-binding transcriptional regulator YafY
VERPARVTANIRFLVARVERQHRLLEAMRQRAPRPLTSAELSQRLEVSTRTVERDIAALVAAGVAVVTRKGRSGGYSFDARSTLKPITFTPGEAAALVASLVALGPFATATAATALQKLLVAMTD